MSAPPLFTVVIPAYNVQGYLRQAVMSVASYDSVEVLVVDDRSTDGTSLLADELEEQFSTVRVVRPPQNVGLGRARNLGMSQARGAHILFIDGDDYLIAGALDELRTVIDDCDPDVIVFGYSRLFANGTTVEGVQQAPLQVEGPFTAAQNVEILDVLNVAWNKVYKRAFLERLGIEFPVGYYEDIPWTYPVLVSASSIVGVDEPFYMYRQRLSGSILRSTDARHVEIIDQIDRLMDWLEEREVSAELRSEVFTRAFRNLVTLATVRRHRIPPKLRRDFYAKARQSVRTHAPEGYVLPTSGDKWKLMRLVWTVGYAGFSTRLFAVDLIARSKAATRRVARFGVRALRAVYHNRRAYGILRRATRVDKNLVVLESLWGLAPRLNCLAVEQEIRRAFPHKRIVWSVNPTDTAGVATGTEFVVKGTHKYYRALAKASHFFVDANLPAWWRKRSGQVLTQLHHGTPLKLMGVEERSQDLIWKNGLLSRCQQWDFSVVSNSYSAEVWKHSYPVRYETLEYGYPRNDVLVNAGPADCSAARERIGLSADARVLLYVPTFRERERDPISSRDLEFMMAGLDEGDVLLVRGHYLARRERGGTQRSSILDVTQYPAVEDLYLAADVLVTDYSSAMFDFANLGRPIVIFATDWEDYRHERGTYFDITVDAPGSVVTTAADLASCLKSREYSSPSNMARLQKFQEIFCEFETGHAARDVVARVMGGERGIPVTRKRVPALTTWRMDRIA